MQIFAISTTLNTTQVHTKKYHSQKFPHSPLFKYKAPTNLGISLQFPVGFRSKRYNSRSRGISLISSSVWGISTSSIICWRCFTFILWRSLGLILRRILTLSLHWIGILNINNLYRCSLLLRRKLLTSNLLHYHLLASNLLYHHRLASNLLHHHLLTLNGHLNHLDIL